MAKNPILPLYYNDIDRATRTWTDEEFGAYMRLLIEQWDKGGLPNSYQKLTRLATSLDTNWPMLKEKFVLVDGVLKNLVMEEIREKQRKHKVKQKENIEKRYQKPTKQPTKTLPLESEYENEIENEDKDKGKGVGKPLRWEDDLIYPFDSDLFKTNWKAHREMREAKHKEYLTRDSEQASLMAISRLTKNETEAIQIIQQSLANGWQDFFKLKTDGKQQTTIDRRDQSKQDTADAVKRHYADRLASEGSKTGI